MTMGAHEAWGDTSLNEAGKDQAPARRLDRNRVIAFAPIGVALIGIAVMAAVGAGRPDTATAAVDTIDAIVTGSVAGE